jgi:hypothetical protein
MQYLIRTKTKCKLRFNEKAAQRDYPLSVDFDHV